jgi:predicted O-methyltransferase YrrM
VAQPGGLGWELGADDRGRILHLLDRFARPVVVELGAGDGTIALARGVAERSGTLTSVEHDPAWVARVTEALAQAGLDGSMRVLHAPLEPHPLAEPGVAWYSGEALRELPQGIHLLLVDGPPAGGEGSELSRAPALEALESKLATDAIVVLDDVHRPGERAIVERWEQRTGFRFSAPENGRIAVGLRPGR